MALNGTTTNGGLLQATIDNVMQQTDKSASEKLSNESCEIKGYDLNKGLDYGKLLESYLTTGFQATNFGKAVHEINRMV